MLVDRTGALRRASGSDRVVEAGCRRPERAPSMSVVARWECWDVYSTGSRDVYNSAAAALQAHGGLVATLLVAAVTARRTGRLADQLQAALAHRSLIEQAVEVLVDREGLDAPAALERLRTASRSSEWTPVQMARSVLGGAPLPSDRLAQATAQRHEATERAVGVHRRDSELHEGGARRYERHGQAGRAQTERLQAVAAWPDPRR
jgi:ANTAR domain